jgi:hypothetical protein
MNLIIIREKKSKRKREKAGDSTQKLGRNKYKFYNMKNATQS